MRDRGATPDVRRDTGSFHPATIRDRVAPRARSHRTREGGQPGQRLSDRITCSESKATDSHSSL